MNNINSICLSRDSLTMGAKYIWSEDPRSRFIARGFHQQAKNKKTGDSRSYIWSVGSELELTE